MGATGDRDVTVRGLLRSVLDRCDAVASPDELRTDRTLRVVNASHLAALLAEAIERAPAARADRVREDLSRLLERRYQDLHRLRTVEGELTQARESIAALEGRLEAAATTIGVRDPDPVEETNRRKEEAGRDSRRRALSEEEEARARANELALLAARAELERAHSLISERSREVARAAAAHDAASARVRVLEAEAAARREEIAALEARLTEALAAGDGKAERARARLAESADARDAVMDRVASILGGGGPSS